MAAISPRQSPRGIFSTWKDYFLPPPVTPARVPLVPQNKRPLSEQEIARLRRQQAKAIDKYFDEEADKSNFDEINNKNRSLQWMPDITPQDPLWRRTRAFYAHLLKSERVSDVLDDNLEDIQKILINPQVWSNEVQAVRDQQSKEYYDNLSPGGVFDGELDNLATKMTMVHFGLPVAPMTLNNIMVLTPGWADTEDDEEDPIPTPPRQQRIIYSEKPLEFLDSYVERGFGYQIMRRPRVNMRGGAGSIKELIPEDKRHFEWGSNVNMRGGGGEPLQGIYLDLLGPRPKLKHLRTHMTHHEFLASAHELIECPKGSDWAFNVDIYRQTDPRKIDIPLEASYQIDSIADFGGKWIEIVETIGKVDHDQLTIIIEEERFQDEHAPQIYEDLVRLAKEIPEEHKKVSLHKIYSYFGQREITPRYLAFKNAVTKLLNIDPTSNWSFLVDIHLPDRVLPPRRFTRPHYRNDFLTLRDNFLLGADINNAKVFVRHTGGYAPSQLNVVEPPKDNLQIVRLFNAQERAETYWKVPSDLNANHCLNSLQPAFVRAFLGIFGQDRPYRNVRLSNKHREGNPQHAIGFGGMEVTQETWSWVREQIEERRKNPPAAGANPLSCELDITVPDLGRKIQPEAALSLHLIGDDYDRDIVFNRVQYTLIYSYILERLSKRHTQYANPSYPNGSSIAMWFSAIEREENSPPVILQVDRRDEDSEQIRKLKDAFSGRVQTFTNIWFRPEYRVFTIHDFKEPARVWQWNTTDEQHDTSLKNFRENVREMYDDWDPALDSNFILLQPQAQRSFAVDRKTTENYWRKYIFDWITETDIFIERRSVRPFMQPDPIPWGYRHTRPAPVAPPVDPNPVPVPPIVDPTQKPRINKTRLILPVAEKPITPKWETWMTDQHRQDALQRRSYIQDQSVIEPGLDPSAPTYGPSKELSLGVSLSTPTVYMQRLTTTDIMQLAEENQKLRNGLLERTHNCPICSVSMSGYEHAEIQRHFGQHLVQLQKEGQCPLCERESWSIMTMEQKKEHLETHQVEADTEMIRNFWNGIECPVCDYKLSGFTAEQVLRHMADHLPGIIEFCDKCGLRTAICNHAELVHHRYTCLDKPDRGPLDQEPSFCGDCGQNRTAEDEEERGLHVIDCTARNQRTQDKKFCTKCGIDKSAWSENEITTHDDHCTTPQGLPKEFCLRCGTKLLGLNKQQLDDHRVYCAVRTKEPETLKQRIQELKVRVATFNRVAAKNAASIAWISKQMADVREREHAIAEREARLPPGQREVIPWAEDTKDLGKCPWSVQGCDFYTVGQSRGDIFTHMASHFDPSNALPFDCPFPRCGKKVATPGSKPGNNLHIVDHYRHRHETGIGDVLSAPRISHVSTARDPRKLQRLLEHFQKANEMNTLTFQRNLTPIPKLGSKHASRATGAGAGFYQQDSDALKTGYAYQEAWLPTKEDVLHESIENYNYDYTRDDEEPESPITKTITRTPHFSTKPPSLPITPTKRKPAAPIPEEYLSPTSIQHPAKRLKRHAVYIPSPSPPPSPKSEPATKISRRDFAHETAGGPSKKSRRGRKRIVSLEEDWDKLMEEVDAEYERVGTGEVDLGGVLEPEPEPESEHEEKEEEEEEQEEELEFEFEPEQKEEEEEEEEEESELIEEQDEEEEQEEEEEEEESELVEEEEEEEQEEEEQEEEAEFELEFEQEEEEEEHEEEQEEEAEFEAESEEEEEEEEESEEEPDQKQASPPPRRPERVTRARAKRHI